MDCSFPKNLAALRHERGISQKTAAEALGISQALLSHYEKGIRECGLDFLCRVSDYYGVTADYLLGRSNSRTGFQSTLDPSVLHRRRELFRVLELLCDLAEKAGNCPCIRTWDSFLQVGIYRAARLLLEACDGPTTELFRINAAEARAAADGVMQMRVARMTQLAGSSASHKERPMPFVSNERLLADYPDAAPSLFMLIQRTEKILGLHVEYAEEHE